jgi:hypothetical protein
MLNKSINISKIQFHENSFTGSRPITYVQTDGWKDGNSDCNISEKIRKRLEICHQTDWLFLLPDLKDQGPHPYKTTGETLIY